MMSLEAQRLELERLGFKILESSADFVTAIRKKWHWDCVLARITYVVFLRKVGRLSAEQIESDSQSLTKEVKRMGPGILRRGFPLNASIFTVYFAEWVDESARQVCEARPKRRFAHSYISAAKNLKTGDAYYPKKMPSGRYLLSGKFNFLLDRVLKPSAPPAAEPVSGLGIVLTVVLLILFLIAGLVK